MPRRLLHIPRFAFRILIGVGLASLFLFFALTRTQVGREGLRLRLEHEFQSVFEGHLRIGSLSGNLINDLFATDVAVLDPQGATVIHVDSVVMRPRWLDMFRRSFSVRELELYNPQLYLRTDVDSSWNFRRTFSRKTAQLGQSPWQFTSADLSVIDGAVHVRPVSFSAWASQQLREYEEIDIESVSLHATVEWEHHFKLVDVLHLSAHFIQPDLRLEGMQGQLVQDEEELQINQLALLFEASRIRLDGAVAPFSAISGDSLHTLRGMVSLQNSHLDFSEWGRLFHLPVSDAVDIDLEVQGSVGDFSATVHHLSRGRSRIQGTTTVRGLPNTAVLEVELQPSLIYGSDVVEVLKAPILAPYGPIDSVLVSGAIQGTLADASNIATSRLSFTSTVSLNGAAGVFEGMFAASRDSSWTYESQGQFDNLNLRLLQVTEAPTILSGLFSAEGKGTLHPTDVTAFSARLDRSLVLGRTLDSLNVRLEASANEYHASGRLYTDQGWLQTEGSLKLQQPRSHYRLNLETHHLNLAPLLANTSFASSINAEAQLRGEGFDFESLSADLTVRNDPSRILYGKDERHIDQGELLAKVRPAQSTQPRLEVSGDILEGALNGDFALNELGQLLKNIRASITDFKTRQQQQPYVSDFAFANESRLPPPPTLSPFEAHLKLNIKRGDQLAALLPFSFPFKKTTVADVSLESDSTNFSIRGTVLSDSTNWGSIQLQGLEGVLSGSAQLGKPLEESLTLSALLHGDSLSAGTNYPDPVLAIDYANRGASIRFQAGEAPQAGPVQLGIQLDFLDHKKTLTLNEFAFTFGDAQWQILSQTAADLYSDALVVPQIALASDATENLPAQSLNIQGTFSNVRTDTLHLSLSDVALRQLSSVLPFRYSVDGRLNADVAFTNFAAPALAGSVTVDTLSLDQYSLGQLSLTSSFIPGAPDVALSASLQPAPTPSTDKQAKENRLTLEGTLRLPSASASDAGDLNLSLGIERADPFFFELIYPSVLAEATGAISGDVTISGPSNDPVLGGQIGISDGRFLLPRFNLDITADATGVVARDGLHMDRLHLADKSGGTADIQGSMLFNNYDFFSFDLEGTLEDFQIIDVAYSNELPFYGHIWASGNATLQGPLFNAVLRSPNAVTTPQSELYVPITEETSGSDPGFIIFADESGAIPDIRSLTRRAYLLASRPEGERQFVDGLEMDLNIFAPSGSTVHLVIDPLLGDVINAVGSGRIQLQLQDDEFRTFGSFDVDAGDYLFTASEVFVRRFLIEEGTLTWDGDPLNARMDISAAYRTRASRAGLPAGVASNLPPLIPLIVWLDIEGRVESPEVDLTLAVDQSRRDGFQDAPFLESVLNQQDRSAEYATSVLLTNSFLLTTEGTEGDVLAGSAFNSVSQLVASQLNRYLNEALPNVDFSIGVQGNERVEDLDVTAGLAFRLLDERLVIRGEGVYRGLRPEETIQEQQGLQGEFVVEVRLSPSVSVEVFYRREGDILNESLLTNTTGASLSYQTQFPTWKRLLQRLRRETTTPSVPPDSLPRPIVEEDLQ